LIQLGSITGCSSSSSGTRILQWNAKLGQGHPSRNITNCSKQAW